MKLFVGGLTRDLTDGDLLRTFESFGKVESATVVKDKFTGESKGFGFVEMPSELEARLAITGMNEKELKGRTIKVNESRPREESGGSGKPRGGERRY